MSDFRPKVRLLFSALVCLLVLQPRASALDPLKKITQYVHEVWQSEHGLPQNSVRAIVQTRDGYLWLATEEGLARFDGVHFAVFDTQNTDAIKNNIIGALLEDRNSNLWIGTVGGLTRFKDGKFTTYTNADGLSNNDILSIAQDRAGTLWIGTLGGGVNRWKDGRFIAYTTEQGLPNNTVRALYPSRDGSLWIGTDTGLGRLENGKISTYSAPEGPGQKRIFSIWESSKGVLWIGSSQGLYTYQRGKFTAVQKLSRAIVQSLCEDRDGNLWAGTDHGLYRLGDGKVDTYRPGEGLSEQDVRSIYEDHEGSLFVGTYSGGLNRFRDGKFTPYGTPEGLSSNSVATILQASNGDIWLGTWGGGLQRFRQGQFETFAEKDGFSDYVSSIWEDRRGNLWVGGTTHGVSRFAKDGRITSLATKNGLASDTVGLVYEDSQGAIWIGTEHGLSRFQNGKFTLYTAQRGLSSNLIVSIYEDHKGDLWVGTRSGLNLLRNGEPLAFPAKETLSHDFISTITEQPEGTLWIATQSSGIKRIRDGKLTSYSMKEGLFQNTVWTVLFDEKGNAWMSSNKGVFRVSRQELDDFADAKIKFLHSVVYGTADGMRSSECNSGQPAGWRSRDGKLWFPTVKGIAVVDPNHIPINTLPPPVWIEEVTVNDRHIKNIDSGLLSASSKRFQFHYTGLSLLIPEKVQFRYKLVGFDKDWVEAGSQRTAYYTNLPSGDYTFNVIAANNDGVWNETGASFSFYLKPPFYQTYWFYALCTFGVLLSGTGVHRLRARARELAHQVEEQTKDLEKERGFLRQVLDINPSFIFAKDRSGRFTLANKALADHFRTTTDALLGKTDAEVHAEPREAEAFRRDDLEVMDTLREKIIPEEPSTDAGGKLHWMQAVKRPIIGEDGKANQVLGVATDITERKRAEEELRKYKEHLEEQVAKRTAELSQTNRQLRQEIAERKRLEEHLRQTQKMEAIGRLSGGIAHDFNNLLTVIEGYGHMVLDRVAHDPELRHYGEQINEAAERASSLTSQLLAFSRRQVLQPKVINLNSLMMNLHSMLQRLIGEDIEMVTVAAPDLGSVNADPGQIEQAIMNLVLNARDAMPQGGKLTLETANVDLDEAYAREHVGAHPGPCVMLAVSDTGVGMDRETQLHLFEPFFTTKEKGRGTGLGLAMVYGTVKQSGGSIWVYSEPGQGTTFKIYLPRVKQAAETLPSRQTPAAQVRGTETILLVEDDRQVRELAHSVLTACGYSVLVAEQALAVASMCEQFAGPIHLLLTDLVMPGLNGRELASRVIAQRPDIKVLFMSGYTTNGIVHRGTLDGGTFFLQKPFTPASLAGKVREVLDLPRS